VLFGKSFITVGVWPHFSLFVDPISNRDRPLLLCPLKLRKRLKPFN